MDFKPGYSARTAHKYDWFLKEQYQQNEKATPKMV